MSSYLTVSPLPRLRNGTDEPLRAVAEAVCFLWHFPYPGRKRPERWALPTTAPFGVRTFLRGTTFRTGNRLEACPERPGDHRARVAELLEAVGLPADSGSRYPHEFSGGQRQRIAIARALAPHPSVLIADEAVSALDVSVRAQVLNLLNRLIADLGLTLVFISHDMSVIRYMCARVAVLYRGRLVEEGATDEIYESPQDAYTRSLLAAVPRLGRELGEPELTAEVER